MTYSKDQFSIPKRKIVKPFVKDFHFSYYEQAAFCQKETPFSGTNKETLIKGYKIADKLNFALLAHFVENYNIRTP